MQNNLPNFFEVFAERPQATQILRTAVSYGGERLYDLLSTRTPIQLSVPEIRIEVEGNLWMLTPEAFRYFLPAFLHNSLESYRSISVFASELVGALTEPSRTDVEGSLDRLTQLPPTFALSPDTTDSLRQQQMEWFDSGTPLALFHERFDSLTLKEGAAVYSFFVAFQEAYGADFPFDELEIAIERYWSRYQLFDNPN